MGTESQAKDFFTNYGLADLPRISDPENALYKVFGLSRANLTQLFGFKSIIRGFQAFIGGNGLGIPVGDPLQMPGVFLIELGKIVSSFVHQTAADRPDYAGIARCEDTACKVHAQSAIPDTPTK